MKNQEAIEDLKNFSLEEMKEFLNANDQISFANDSKVRLFCKKHYPNAYEHGIVFALNMMYIDLSYALYEVLDDIVVGFAKGE